VSELASPLWDPLDSSQGVEHFMPKEFGYSILLDLNWKMEKKMKLNNLKLR